MYFPKFEYTSKFVLKLMQLEQSKTLLQASDLKYTTKTKILQKAKTKNLFQIGVNIGLELTIKDAEKAILGTKPRFEDDLLQKIFINSRQGIEYIHSSEIKNYQEFDNAVYQEINKKIVFDWKETWDAKYRNFNERYDDTADPLAHIRNTSIKGNELDVMVNDLIEWYKSAAPTVAPIIRIGVVFHRLLEIAPFIAGNTITTMLLIEHLLLTHGYSTKVFSSSTAAFLQNKENLADAFETSSQAEDLSYWLEWFVGVLENDLVSVRESIHDYVKEEEKSKSQPFLDLNNRQMKVLKYLQSVPTIKREEYCNIMEVSTMTAFRDLRDLVKKKLIKTEGRGRGTKYRLTNY